MNKLRAILSFICLVGCLSLSQSARANDFLDYVVATDKFDSLSVCALLNMRFTPTYVADNHLKKRRSYGTLYGTQSTNNIYAPRVPIAEEQTSMRILHINIAPPKGRLTTSNTILPQAKLFAITESAPKHVYIVSPARPLRTGNHSIPIFAKPPSTGGGDPVIPPPDIWNTPIEDGTIYLLGLLFLYTLYRRFLVRIF